MAFLGKNKINKQSCLKGRLVPGLQTDQGLGGKLLCVAYFYDFSSTKEYQAFAVPDPGRHLACFDSRKTRNKQQPGRV